MLPFQKWHDATLKQLKSWIQHLHEFGEYDHIYFERVNSNISYVKASILKYSVNNLSASLTFNKLIQQLQGFFWEMLNNT